MAAGDATAADVPSRYDVVINGKGYRILDTIEPSLPFRSHRAIYGISPTFIERSNVSGAYGDNQQSFWLTFNQNDWSLGEQQRYFRPNGADADVSKRRYWQGSNLNVTDIPGQVKMQNPVSSPSFGSTIAVAVGIANHPADNIFAASFSNLYQIDNTGTVIDKGAHGGSGTQDAHSICGDGNNVFMAFDSLGKIIKWSGSAFSTFATLANAGAIRYLNNTLYCISSTGSTFNSIDTSGNVTALFTWKDATGGTIPITTVAMAEYGGDMLIMRSQGAEPGCELWIYDGNGVSTLAKFPSNFVGNDICVVNGVALIAGSFITVNSTMYQGAVFYYANGNFGLLWKANGVSSNLTHTTVVPWRGGAVIADESTGNLLYYESATGGLSTIATFTTGSIGNGSSLAACATSLMMFRSSATNTTFYPSSTSATTTSTLTSSLYDFDSSLTKFFRGITIQFDSATDGNGGSIDIAYQLNSVDGAFTTLQVGATSGTEYTLSQTGQSLCVKLTLNKGTSTNGPVLKRVYVRAAPELQTYRFRTYVLDLSGIGWKDPVKLMDGTYHPLSGHEQAANLLTAFSASAPFSVTDRFSTFTGICDITPSAANPAGGCEIYEMREGNDDPNFSGGFAAKVTIREV